MIQSPLDAALDAYADKLTEIFDEFKELQPAHRRAAMEAALAAAAEVGPQGYPLTDPLLRVTINDVIERCAQVVKARADYWNEQAKQSGICAESLADECEDIFAAIRALKEKP